jgi:hypothetical protein
VVGIEGKWGEGKTSCINLILEILQQKTPPPIIVEYKPWLVSTLDSLIEGFFIQLASSIGSSSSGKEALRTARNVLRFAKLLAPIKLIPGVEPWGTIVEKVLASVGTATQAASEFADLSLSARKEELKKDLAELNLPVVVVVDDIDRLPPQDVRTVFQMLKAVADFPRISYLVAYDPEPVTEALGYDRIYDGGRFLEKLIQVSYPLPRLSFVHRRDYLEFRVQKLLGETGITLPTPEDERWVSLLDETELVRMLSTPRDMCRLLNRLRLTATTTKDEVCFADVLAFESLEMKYPKITQFIRNRPEEFLEIESYDKELFSKDTAIQRQITRMDNKGEDFLETLLRECDDARQKREVSSLLKYMFPQIDTKHQTAATYSAGENRIRGRDALLKLLHNGLMSFTFSSVVAKRFLSKPAERYQILEDWLEGEGIPGWLQYVGELFGDTLIVDPAGLCHALMQKARTIGVCSPLDMTSHRLGMYISRAIRAQANPPDRVSILQKVVSTPFSLSVSEHTLLPFLSEAGVWSKGAFQDDMSKAFEDAPPDLPIQIEDLYSAIGLWLNAVRTAAHADDFFETEIDPLSVLYRWGQLNKNNYAEPKAYIEKRMRDLTWLPKLTVFFRLDEDVPPLLPEGCVEVLLQQPEGSYMHALGKSWRNKMCAAEIDILIHPSA